MSAGWLPIAEAPRDGTRVAVKFASGFEAEANWQTTYGGEWHVDSWTHLPWSPAPTRWQPLPSPPTPKENPND